MLMGNDRREYFVLRSILKRLRRLDAAGLAAFRRSILLEAILVVTLIVGSFSTLALGILTFHYKSQAAYWKSLAAILYTKWKDDALEQDVLFENRFFKTDKPTPRKEGDQNGRRKRSRSFKEREGAGKRMPAHSGEAGKKD